MFISWTIFASGEKPELSEETGTERPFRHEENFIQKKLDGYTEARTNDLVVKS